MDLLIVIVISFKGMEESLLYLVIIWIAVVTYMICNKDNMYSTGLYVGSQPVIGM